VKRERTLPLAEVQSFAPPAVEMVLPAKNRIGAMRRVFSFPTVIGALLVVLTILTVGGRFNDPDMWWHLKVGEIIWNTHQIPTMDLLSFTTNHHAWIPHEWLAEVSIYGAYLLGGYAGVMAWFCFFSSALLISVYILCSVYSGNAKVAFAGALAAWLFATVGMSIRPHLIGYLLLTLQLLVVHLGRTRDRRWFLCLPVFFALWVNCHGSFVFGLTVLAVQLFCSFVRLRVGLLSSEPWDHDTRDALAGAFVLSLAALFINPVGLQQVIYPFDVMFNQKTNLAAISEWLPPTFADARDLALVAVAALILLIPILRRHELRLEEVLLVAMTFGMAIRHSRMMFVFGIVAAPVLCRLLADAWDSYELAKDRIAPNAVMLALVIVSVAGAFPKSSSLQQQVSEANPVQAVNFLQHSGLSGRMFNEYTYGGYLIWAAPQRKVFIDGRADIFDWTGVLQDYGAFTTFQSNPEVLLKKYDIGICVVSAGSRISRLMRYLPDWKAVHSDPMTTVFARTDIPTQK
jgi:hypothetical protein